MLEKDKFPLNGNIPQELHALRQFVDWRLEQDKRTGKPAKVPYSPITGHRASASNPSTWGTLDEALTCAEKYNFNGIGFVTVEDDGIILIDIDNCLDKNGQPNEIASDIIAHLPPTYIEESPSGKGLHAYLKGDMPKGGNRNSKTGVEMYSSNRYFTLTGKKFQGSVDFIGSDLGGALEYIHQKYIAPAKKSKKQSKNHPGAVSELDDDQLIQLAQASKDGEGFSTLWDGKWQGKFKSQSEADFSLCQKLAFWSGKNQQQMDRLFRRSALFREKWDARHSADGTTYGEQTITNVCNMTDSVYSPPAQKKQPDIYPSGGCYFRNKGDKFYQITNFTVISREMVIADDEAQISCDFVSESGEKFPQNLLSSDFSTVAKLRGVLNKNTIALSFMGGENDLELFKIHLYAMKWQKKRGVKAIGIYPRNKQLVYVDTTGAVGVGGKKNNDIVQMERFKSGNRI